MTLEIIQYILLGISLAAPIGPVGIELIRRGLKNGFLSGFLVGFGAIFADLTWAFIAYFEIANFITIPIVRTVLWLSGAWVLCYLGYKSFMDYSRRIELEELGNTEHKNSFITGFLIAISSPITMVWWITVAGSMAGQATNGLFNISAIIFGIFLWVCFLSMLLHWGKKFVNEKSMRYVSAIGGIILILFGIYFAYSAYLSITIL
ncbi:LysE family transporter [Candidatus Micrarchaeota archaeon]|nr:LysE family transporter [Candidatus Micrarchaeota archaeon]